MAELQTADIMFLYALYLLVKQYGKDGELKFPVEETTPLPQDGVWSFATKFEKETGNCYILLIEGKDAVERTHGKFTNETDQSIPTGREESEEDKLVALREKWLREDTPIMH